jgi:hypothetical protein
MRTVEERSNDTNVMPVRRLSGACVDDFAYLQRALSDESDIRGEKRSHLFSSCSLP